MAKGINSGAPIINVLPPLNEAPEYDEPVGNQVAMPKAGPAVVKKVVVAKPAAASNTDSGDYACSKTLGNAGNAVAIGVTSDNIVVMVWYDAENNNLIIL